MKLHQLLTESVEKSLRDIEVDGKRNFEGTVWDGDFDCSNQQLTSLNGAPSEVNGDFRCLDNQLTSLEGAPSEVDGDFNCSRNELTSLKGAPSEVGGSFVCYRNQLTSLKDIHKQIHRIDGYLDVSGCPIKSHVLGVLKIKDLKEIKIGNKQVQTILNKYLPVESASDIVDCQEELFQADLDEYAQF